MKGVDLECVRLVANQKYKGDSEEEKIYNLFLDLYHGKPIEFDLCLVKVRMEMTKQQRMINKSNMIRVLMFKGNKREYCHKK